MPVPSETEEVALSSSFCAISDYYNSSVEGFVGLNLWMRGGGGDRDRQTDKDRETDRQRQRQREALTQRQQNRKGTTYLFRAREGVSMLNHIT